MGAGAGERMGEGGRGGRAAGWGVGEAGALLGRDQGVSLLLGAKFTGASFPEVWRPQPGPGQDRNDESHYPGPAHPPLGSCPSGPDDLSLERGTPAAVAELYPEGLCFLGPWWLPRGERGEREESGRARSVAGSLAGTTPGAVAED